MNCLLMVLEQSILEKEWYEADGCYFFIMHFYLKAHFNVYAKRGRCRKMSKVYDVPI